MPDEADTLLFHSVAAIGEKLMHAHLNYDEVEPYPLDFIVTPGMEVSYRVKKMRLSSNKMAVIVNESLILGGIPLAVFEYRLGNRSALEWIIDQYQITTDPRSGMMSDPNREDDPQYIVRLIGQVVEVSLQTVALTQMLEGIAPPETWTGLEQGMLDPKHFWTQAGGNK